MCVMLQTKKASEKSFFVLPRGKGMAEETGGEAETSAGLYLVLLCDVLSCTAVWCTVLSPFVLLVAVQFAHF